MRPTPTRCLPSITDAALASRKERPNRDGHRVEGRRKRCHDPNIEPEIARLPSFRIKLCSCVGLSCMTARPLSASAQHEHAEHAHGASSRRQCECGTLCWWEKSGEVNVTACRGSGGPAGKFDLGATGPRILSPLPFGFKLSLQFSDGQVQLLHRIILRAALVPKITKDEKSMKQ